MGQGSGKLYAAKAAWFLLVVMEGLSPSLAFSAETITYTYDVHGRVVGVSHTGSVNNGLNVTYTYDAADNRANVTTTGSPH